MSSYDHIILDHNGGEHQKKPCPQCPICAFEAAHRTKS